MTDRHEKTPAASAPADAAAAAPGVGFDAVAAAAELDAALGDDATTSEDPGAARYIEELEREVLSLNDLVAALQSKVLQAEARADQAHDQVEAAKARLQQEASKQLARRTRALLLPFLAVLDNLDRALAAMRGAEPNPDVLSGIELVQRRFEAALQGVGVRRQAARDAAFDPALHEAMTTAPPPTEAQDGRIIAVLREGFVIDEDGVEAVLRPAQVVVGKA